MVNKFLNPFKQILKSRATFFGILICLLFCGIAFAQSSFPAIKLGVEESTNPQDFSLTVKIVILMTILSLAPSIIMMMTCFTRIIIVFHFLRSALGTQSAPSNQILVGLALFITYFVMSPVIDEVNKNANSEGIKSQYLRNTDNAYKQGVFGSPSFIYEGEVFWGDDRLEDCIKWINSQ